jgi:hypothetical protein
MNRRILGFTAACVALFIAAGARAADLPLPNDGWASWEVAAVEGAQAMCCFGSWDQRDAKAKACNLDGREKGYGSRDHSTTDTVRVYAKLANGKVQKLRTLASACPVETKSPIKELGTVSTDDSARWLISLKRSELDRDDWLSSLAIHRGDLPFTALKDMALSDGDIETRKQSIFWLAIQRGTAQTEEVIVTALHKDKSADVREQAVFALAQLPDEHATPALIRVAEDRSLDRDQRKRALFWLGQSDDAAALAYMEEVLLGSASANPSRR